MTRISLFVAAGVLVFAAPAAAKEITAAQVCGASGCADVELPQGLHEFPGAGGISTTPPPAGPFVEVVLTFDGRHVERVWFVPGERLFAMPDNAGAIRWAPASLQDLDRHIVAAAGAVQPHRPRVSTAYVEGASVAGDASGYLTLFGVGSAPRSAELGDGFASVSIKTTPDSPWAHDRLWFYPDSGLLQRGNEFVVLPAAVADDLRHGRPIRAAGTGGSSFDWPLVTGWLLVALALGLGAAALARRRPEPAL